MQRHPGFESFPYDALDKPGKRAKAARRVLEQWLSGASNRAENAALLIKTSGQIDAVEYERLFDKRDLRLINLIE